MSEETKSPTSPQLAFDESSGLAVVLTPKQTVSLYKKSKSSGIPFDTLEEVYRRGYSETLSEQVAYDRVNSFVAGGAAIMIDKDLLEKRGLWDNIHAKRERIKHGSGEHMRKPGSKGAPTSKDFKDSQVNEVSAELIGKVNKARTIDKKPSKTEAGTKTLQLAVKNAFIGKSVKEAYTGAEATSNNRDEASNRFVGTDTLVNNYKETTPGQSSRLSTIKKVVKEAQLQECNGNCTCGKDIKENKYKSETGGLTKAGVDKYNRDNPGHHLKMAVTTPPSKLAPGGKAAGRRKSFCARMSGVEGPMKDEHGKPTRKALALRKWNC